MWDDWVLSLSDCDEVLQECDLFFVYGTLQSFSGNNRLLAQADLIEDQAITQDKYVLGTYGCPYAFPKSVVPEKHHNILFPVKGEVWRVTDPSTCRDLDMLEGHPDHYEREIIDLADGTRAWMYLQKDWSQARGCNACHLIEGVWKWQDC
jgi:gamma-glutamylcyclotransferase (GGCT)/AIG2-like uncharacterized protein YtfP